MTDYATRQASVQLRAAPTSAPAPAPAPGRQPPSAPARDAAPDPAEPIAGPAAIHAAASRGIATPASRLPFIDRIQRAFGRHDVSGVETHVGAGAAASARAMGAHGFATGNHVVLGESADLFTVAHEAAHVVQQRGGIQLRSGVGEDGDDHERHANEVAALVVRDESAEHLLGEPGAPRGAGPAAGVQRFRIHGGDGTRFAVSALSGSQVREYFALAQQGLLEWDDAAEAKALQVRFRALRAAEARKRPSAPAPSPTPGPSSKPSLVPYAKDSDSEDESERGKDDGADTVASSSKAKQETSASSNKRQRTRGSDDERGDEREDERGDEPEQAARPESELGLRVQASAAVGALRGYGDDWNAARDQLVAELLSLQPFLTPPSSGPQQMWDDSDPLLEILARGFLTIRDNIEASPMMKQVLTRQRALAVEGVSFGALAAPKRTLLTFLTDATHQCAQATDGEIREWVVRLRAFNA